MATRPTIKLTVKTCFVLIFLTFANFALAGSHTIPNPIASKSFEGIITSIANFALTLLTPVAILVILYAGALYLFSGGDVEKVKRAHKALIWALVGIAIVLTGSGFISIIKDILK